jgi:hypothetical protein
VKGKLTSVPDKIRQILSSCRKQSFEFQNYRFCVMFPFLQMRETYILEYNIDSKEHNVIVKLNTSKLTNILLLNDEIIDNEVSNKLKFLEDGSFRDKIKLYNKMLKDYLDKYEKFIEKYIDTTYIYDLKNFTAFKFIPKEKKNEKVDISSMEQCFNGSFLEENSKPVLDENDLWKIEVKRVFSIPKREINVKIDEWKYINGFRLCEKGKFRLLEIGLVSFNFKRSEFYIIMYDREMKISYIIKLRFDCCYVLQTKPNNVLFNKYDSLIRNDEWWNKMNEFYEYREKIDKYANQNEISLFERKYNNTKL